MNTARQLLCTLTVAAMGFAATASAATINVVDEFGAPVRNATVTVSSLADTGNGLAATMSGPRQAVALQNGGYFVSGVSGMAKITLTHPAYGTVYAKGDFSESSIELIVGGDQGGFSMWHVGMPGPVASAQGPTSNVGGDTCATATTVAWAAIIAGGGYTDSGTTGTADNSGVICGATPGSDVFYTFTPATNSCLRLTTCLPTSPGDTILQVKSGAGCATTEACNDDSCVSPPGGHIFNSTLPTVPVTANTQYFVQIDNWASNASLAYTLNIQTTTGCPAPLPPCPADGVLENEPNCGINNPPLACAGNDTVNGGCNYTPNLFSDVECGQTVCGTYGNCGATRDTDWWQQIQTSLTVNSWCCIGEAPSSVWGLVNNGGGTGLCPATAFAAFSVTANNVEGCVTQLMWPGTWWWFAGTNSFAGVPCGGPTSDYQCTLTCVCPDSCGGNNPPTGTEPTNFQGRSRN